MTEYEKALDFNRRIREALRTVYEALNHGQQQKLLKDEEVKALFERYKVIDEGSDAE